MHSVSYWDSACGFTPAWHFEHDNLPYHTSASPKNWWYIYNWNILAFATQNIVTDISSSSNYPWTGQVRGDKKHHEVTGPRCWIDWNVDPPSFSQMVVQFSPRCNMFIAKMSSSSTGRNNGVSTWHKRSHLGENWTTTSEQEGGGLRLNLSHTWDQALHGTSCHFSHDLSMVKCLMKTHCVLQIILSSKFRSTHSSDVPYYAYVKLPSAVAFS